MLGILLHGVPKQMPCFFGSAPMSVATRYAAIRQRFRFSAWEFLQSMILFMIEILHHLLYTKMYYTSRVPILFAYEVCIRSNKISIINSIDP